MICGIAIGSLAVAGLVILVAGVGLGALVTIVGIESERKREQAVIIRAAREVCIAQHMSPRKVPAAIYELSKAIDASLEEV